MAQSPPFSDVALDSKRQRSDETVRSQAAKAAITAMAVKLCDGMESLSVALELHAKHLVSDNTLEAVREFQEVKKAKNSRILESVKHAITVIGLQGFQDFLSVLGKFQLLRSLVTDLQESYQEHLQDNQSWNHQNRLFWEQLELQPMPTNHLCHDEHVTNRVPQREQSKLLSLMLPKPSPGAHHMGSQLPMERPIMALDNQQPMPSQSSPLQSVNGSHPSAHSGLILEQSASSPSPFSTNQPAWQQEIWLPSGSDRHSPPDSGVHSLLSSSSMTGHSDSIMEQFSHYSEGLSHSPQQPAISTHMFEVLPSGSSSSSGGSSLEKQENSKKLHRQKSFDEHSVLKQGSRTDSMDSGITGSQASLDNDDAV